MLLGIGVNGNVKLITVFNFKANSVSSETMFIKNCQAVCPDRLLFLLENNLHFLCYGVESVSHKLLSPLRTRSRRDNNFLCSKARSPNDEINPNYMQ